MITKIVYIAVDLEVVRLIFAINKETTVHFLPLFLNERFVKTDELNLMASPKNSDRGKIPQEFRQGAEWYSNIRSGSPTYKTLLRRFSKGAPIEYLDPPLETETLEAAKKDLRTLILEQSITFEYNGDRLQLLSMIREDKNGGKYDQYLQILGFTYNLVNFANYDFSEVGSNYDKDVFIPYSQRGTPIRRY